MPAKTYFHVFARLRGRSFEADAIGWWHEISLDTRADANVDAENLRFHGNRTKIIKSDRDPVALVAELNAAEKVAAA